MTDGRARTSNHLKARSGSEIWDVEVSGECAVTIEADGWLVHTDHCTAPEMQDVERSESAGSRLRLERGRELVAAVLCDHANARTHLATSAAAT